jgi:MOSC domain-containing protein YiiM
MPSAALLSVNVGLPRDVEFRGRAARTSIYKTPVAGPVTVGPLNLDGDQQADPSVHGGKYKAVYVYPSEHYAFWRSELGEPDLGWGAFGENLTTSGLAEDALSIGDRLRVGTAEFFITQPRFPCYKLAGRFGRPEMVERFLWSGRSGFYLSVAREGGLKAGDAVEVVAREAGSLTVAEVVELYRSGTENQSLLRRAVQLVALPQGLRERFRKRLDDPEGAVRPR